MSAANNFSFGADFLTNVRVFSALASYAFHKILDKMKAKVKVYSKWSTFPPQ